MVVGRHAIADIYDCKVNIDDLELIKNILLESAKEANLHVVDIVFHEFEPVGISGVVVLAESHIAIHTWPEYNFVAADAFTCGDKMDPRVVLNIIAKKLNSSNHEIKDFNRGEI